MDSKEFFSETRALPTVLAQATSSDDEKHADNQPLSLLNAGQQSQDENSVIFDLTARVTNPPTVDEKKKTEFFLLPKNEDRTLVTIKQPSPSGSETETPPPTPPRRAAKSNPTGQATVPPVSTHFGQASILSIATARLASTQAEMAHTLLNPSSNSVKMGALLSELTVLENIIKSCTPGSQHSAIGAPAIVAPISAPSGVSNPAPKAREIRDFSKSLPKFFPGVNPGYFLRKLHTHLRMHAVHPEHWLNNLCGAMPAEHHDWCSTHLLAKSVTWSEGIEMWKNNFTKVSDLRIAQNHLLLLSEGRNLLSFCQDFETWWSSANPEGDIDGPSAREEFMNKLNPVSLYIGPLRLAVRTAPPATYEDLKKIALMYQESYSPTIFSNSNASTLAAYPQAPRDRSNRRDRPPRGSAPRQDGRPFQQQQPKPHVHGKSCVHHPWTTAHSTAECSLSQPGSKPSNFATGSKPQHKPPRLLNVVGAERKPSHPASSSSKSSERWVPRDQVAKKSDTKRVTCHLCQQVGHFASDCTSRSRQVNRISATRTPTRSHENQGIEAPKSVAMQTSNTTDKNPRILTSLPNWRAACFPPSVEVKVLLKPPTKQGPTELALVKSSLPVTDPFDALRSKNRPKLWADWSDGTSETDSENFGLAAALPSIPHTPHTTTQTGTSESCRPTSEFCRSAPAPDNFLDTDKIAHLTNLAPTIVGLFGFPQESLRNSNFTGKTSLSRRGANYVPFPEFRFGRHFVNGKTGKPFCVLSLGDPKRDLWNELKHLFATDELSTPSVPLPYPKERWLVNGLTGRRFVLRSEYGVRDSAVFGFDYSVPGYMVPSRHFVAVDIQAIPGPGSTSAVEDVKVECDSHLSLRAGGDRSSVDNLQQLSLPAAVVTSYRYVRMMSRFDGSRTQLPDIMIRDEFGDWCNANSPAPSPIPIPDCPPSPEPPVYEDIPIYEDPMTDPELNSRFIRMINRSGSAHSPPQIMDNSALRRWRVALLSTNAPEALDDPLPDVPQENLPLAAANAAQPSNDAGSHSEHVFLVRRGHPPSATIMHSSEQTSDNVRSHSETSNPISTSGLDRLRPLPHPPVRSRISGLSPVLTTLVHANGTLSRVATVLGNRAEGSQASPIEMDTRPQHHSPVSPVPEPDSDQAMDTSDRYEVGVPFDPRQLVADAFHAHSLANQPQFTADGEPSPFVLRRDVLLHTLASAADYSLDAVRQAMRVAANSSTSESDDYDSNRGRTDTTSVMHLAEHFRATTTGPATEEQFQALTSVFLKRLMHRLDFLEAEAAYCQRLADRARRVQYECQVAKEEHVEIWNKTCTRVLNLDAPVPDEDPGPVRLVRSDNRQRPTFIARAVTTRKRREARALRQKLFRTAWDMAQKPLDPANFDFDAQDLASRGSRPTQPVVPVTRPTGALVFSDYSDNPPPPQASAESIASRTRGAEASSSSTSSSSSSSTRYVRSVDRSVLHRRAANVIEDHELSSQGIHLDLLLSPMDFDPLPIPDNDVISVIDHSIEPGELRVVSVAALVDSGCMAFTISERLAKILNGKRAKSTVGLKNPDGSVISGDMTVMSLQIRRRDSEFRAINVVAHVAPIHDKDCLISLQLFPFLGLGITGLGIPLPVATAPEALREISATDDSPLLRINSIELDRLTHATSRAFQENANIPPDAFVDIPGVPLFTVDTGDNPPAYTRQYPLPESTLSKMDDQVAKWLLNGRISRANPSNPWNSPLIAVPKVHPITGVKSMEKPRIVPDLRKVNLARTAKEVPQHMPLITDLYTKCGKFYCCTRLDLSEAFLQFPVAPEDRYKYGFTLRDTKYQFNGIPWGDRLVAGHVQDSVATLLYPHRNCTFNYMDDIVVHSPSLSQHIVDLNNVMATLNAAYLRLNPAKLELGRTSYRLLGKILSNRGVTPDPEKIAAVQQYPQPLTAKALERYLGILNWNQDFMLMHSMVLEPLFAIKTVKHLNRHWSPAVHDAWLLSKKLLAQYIQLTQPDFSQPFHLATDGCITGLGAMLYQKIDGEQRIISTWSRALTAGQKNYSAWKLELLALKSALRFFHDYLYGAPFTIETDHKALTYMLTQIPLNRMLTDWYDEIYQYDFTITHLPGVLNIIPDALSRVYNHEHLMRKTTPTNPIPLDEKVPVPVISSKRRFKLTHAPPALVPDPALTVPGRSIGKITVEKSHTLVPPANPLPNPVIRPEIQKSPSIQGHTLTSAPNMLLKGVLKDIINKNLPPESARPNLVTMAHLEGHFGALPLAQSVIEQGFYWPSLFTDAAKEVKSCFECRRWTTIREGFHPAAHFSAELPGDHICIDHAGPLRTVDGKSFILLIIDVHSRAVYLTAVASTSAADTVKALLLYFCLFGTPKIISSDNGSAFRNKMMAAFKEVSGFDHKFITPYKPRANGMAERAVKTAKDTLRKLSHGFALPWPDVLPMTMFFMNKKIHPATKSSPFAVMFGRQPNGFHNYDCQLPPVPHFDLASQPLTQLTEIMHSIRTETFSALASRQTLFNEDTNSSGVDRARRGKKILKEPFPLDAYVMIRDVAKSKYDKDSPPFVGPYKVKAFHERPGTYSLVDSMDVLLKRHVPAEQIQLIALPEDHFDKSRFEGAYRVKNIITHKGEGSACYYLVQWHDSSIPDSWEPLSNFEDLSVIAKYSALLHSGNLPEHDDYEDPEFDEIDDFVVVQPRPRYNVSFALDNALHIDLPSIPSMRPQSQPD